MVAGVPCLMKDPFYLAPSHHPAGWQCYHRAGHAVQCTLHHNSPRTSSSSSSGYGHSQRRSSTHKYSSPHQQQQLPPHYAGQQACPGGGRRVGGPRQPLHSWPVAGGRQGRKQRQRTSWTENIEPRRASGRHEQLQHNYRSCDTMGDDDVFESDSSASGNRIQRGRRPRPPFLMTEIPPRFLRQIEQRRNGIGSSGSEEGSNGRRPEKSQGRFRWHCSQNSRQAGSTSSSSDGDECATIVTIEKSTICEEYTTYTPRENYANCGESTTDNSADVQSATTTTDNSADEQLATVVTSKRGETVKSPVSLCRSESGASSGRNSVRFAMDYDAAFPALANSSAHPSEVRSAHEDGANSPDRANSPAPVENLPAAQIPGEVGLEYAPHIEIWDVPKRLMISSRCHVENGFTVQRDAVDFVWDLWLEAIEELALPDSKVVFYKG